MKKTSTQSLNGISIALIYDLPAKLIRTAEHPFHPDAEAEWETLETIERIAETWSLLGCRVQKFPLDPFFLSAWAKNHASFDLVHSVVEGWGTPSREAWIPALCELSGTPYIGSDPFAQCVAMRKHSFKILCRSFGIPTPEGRLVKTESDLEQLPKFLLEQPHFIKPDCEGSGMGIDGKASIGKSPDSSKALCRELLVQFPDGVLIEELLEGRELTSGFIGAHPITFLPIAEIEVPDGVYGLANKSKEVMEEKVSFPKLSEACEQRINHSMQMMQKQFGFNDFVRFDWKLNTQGEPMLLEANPLAGLSYYYSVLPKMAEAAGLSYTQFLERLALSALQRKNDRRFWYGQARLRSRPELYPNTEAHQTP
jgi:D-alanine-D-alanine ligase